jgi:glycosyltransferase involved in cell wall biosynthesis
VTCLLTRGPSLLADPRLLQNAVEMPIEIVQSGSTKQKLPDACPGENRLRVLHLNAGNMYGGVETLLTTLASFQHLCPNMEAHFALCYEGRLSRELAAAGAPVYVLGKARISRPWTVWRARRQLKKLLREQRFEVVICHMGWSLAVFGGAVRATGHKVVLWAHGFSNRQTWLDRLASRIVPDLAIANSRFTAEIVHNQFPRIPLRVMYYPVVLADLRESAHGRTVLREEQGAGDDTTVILQVSRLEPWKGHLVHLRALSQLKTKKKWGCWMVGGPQKPDEEEYFRQLQRTANELGIADRVRFLGQRSDVAKLLAAADIFCQPNQGPEPFGIVFIEALWAGRPVVTSALGGALEIVDESCGLLAKPGDPASLAESLQQLVDAPELRQQLGAAGPARARTLSDPARQMHNLMELARGVRQ